MKLVLLAIIVCCLALRCQSIEPKLTSIRVTNGGGWGTWGQVDLCPEGTRADGFALRVESPVAGEDDTALNGIRLYCSSVNSIQQTVIQSTSGQWGNWGPRISCRNGSFLKAFALKVEPWQEGEDDTAANSVKFYCDNGEVLDGMGGPWGTWGGTSASCTHGICALQTKVEAPLGGAKGEDDTALNDVTFICC